LAIEMETRNKVEVDRRLTGVKLRLFRIARLVGLLKAYQAYQLWRYGWSILPGFDPLDTGPLLLALSNGVRDDSHDHIEITESEFKSWIGAELTGVSGFNARKCFRRLTRELGPEPDRRAMMTCGIDRAQCVISAVRDHLLIIDIVRWFDRPPKLSRGQVYHLWQAVKASPTINADVITILREEAAAFNWPFPHEDMIPRGGQRLEICFKRRPLFSRFFRR